MPNNLHADDAYHYLIYYRTNKTSDDGTYFAPDAIIQDMGESPRVLRYMHGEFPMNSTSEFYVNDFTPEWDDKAGEWRYYPERVEVTTDNKLIPPASGTFICDFDEETGKVFYRKGANDAT